MRWLAAVAVAVGAVTVAPVDAVAEDVAVGVYAPNAPFAGASARLDYATDLAGHLARATGGKGTGKVYARASDFAAAVKKGEIQLAVVDAPYLASIGAPYTVLATATRGGDDAVRWQLVARGGEARLSQLEGKKLLCAAVGGRERDFVYNALLGGELARGFFSGVESSPDVLSALAALELGRADAAVVPSGVDLPAGVTAVTTLPEVSWPVLVAFSGTPEAVRKKAAASASTFKGCSVLSGFRVGGADAVKSLARRFSKKERRGPMATPSIRVTVDELVEPRKLTIDRVDVKTLWVRPAKLPEP
jgi:hypothetical protein